MSASVVSWQSAQALAKMVRQSNTSASILICSATFVLRVNNIKIHSNVRNIKYLFWTCWRANLACSSSSSRVQSFSYDSGLNSHFHYCSHSVPHFGLCQTWIINNLLTNNNWNSQWIIHSVNGAAGLLKQRPKKMKLQHFSNLDSYAYSQVSVTFHHHLVRIKWNDVKLPCPQAGQENAACAGVITMFMSTCHCLRDQWVRNELGSCLILYIQSGL